MRPTRCNGRPLEVYRTPHSAIERGPGSGLFKSTDGGAHLAELTKNPGLPGPVGESRRIGVARRRERVYAIVRERDGGVFVSDDGGATWKQANDERAPPAACVLLHAHLRRHERARHGLRANTGFYKSTDAGKTYRTYRVPHGDTTTCGSPRTTRSG